MDRWTQRLGGHCWLGVSAGNLPPTPPSGPARGHADMGTTEPRCTLDQRVSPAAIACPARAPARPSAGPPLTYCARLGLWGAPPGVHDSLSSGFNVLYLFGADSAPIKGWKWLWLCLRGPGSGWGPSVALRSRGGRRGVTIPFLGPQSLTRPGIPEHLSQALHHQAAVRGL